MQEFDPRKVRLGFAPRAAAGVIGLLAVALAAHVAGWRAPPHSAPPTSVLARAAIPTIRPAAVAAPVDVSVQVKSGETLEGAIRRAGVTARDAHQGVAALAQAINPNHIRAGLTFVASVSSSGDRSAPARLIGLSMRTGPTSGITLTRAPDGALSLKRTQDVVRDGTTVAQGAIHDSLYQSAEAAGAPPKITAQMARLLAHKLDLTRDIRDGDRFRIVYTQSVTALGRRVAVGDLTYAEIRSKGRLIQVYAYRAPGGARPEFLDENGELIATDVRAKPGRAEAASALDGVQMAAFQARKTQVETMVAGLEPSAPKLASADPVGSDAASARTVIR